MLRETTGAFTFDALLMQKVGALTFFVVNSRQFGAIRWETFRTRTIYSACLFSTWIHVLPCAFIGKFSFSD